MKSSLRMAFLGIAKLTILTTIVMPALAETINIGRSDVELIVPKGYSAENKTPLIISLHGYSLSAAEQEAYFGFSELVDEYNFLLLTPEGTTEKGPGQNMFWNATAACCDLKGAGVDDSMYLNNLIADMQSNYNVDENRIFVFGYSNGGFMAHRLAFDYPDKIAAIASFAGASLLNMTNPSPERPVNILEIHGTADKTVAFLGGFISGFQYPGANDSLLNWIDHNAAILEITKLQQSLDVAANISGNETTITQYDTAGAIELWTVQGGGHTPFLATSFKRNVIDWLYAHPKGMGVLDFDLDGIGNNVDTDDDNDGVLDLDDAFPLDPNESLDTDGDAIGDNADTDDDGDGILDVDDVYPLDATNIPTARLKNIATRGFVGTGDNVLIGGFVIMGTEPKTVVIRAKGPSLSDLGVPNVLVDPQMNLFSGASVISSNDNWQTHENVALIPDELKPSNDSEAVIAITLAPGAYTAIVNGLGGGTGIGIIEVFEVGDSGFTRLNNIATRGFVGTGDDVLIGGIVITGTDTKTLVIRAKGPSLGDAGVPGALENPTMTLFSGATVIDSNDDWQSHNRAGDIPNNLKPDNDLESVILREFPPGSYTAIVSGVEGGTGVGLVEVFEIR